MGDGEGTGDVASRYASAWRTAKAALQAESFRPRRLLGQNFLTDGRVAARILEAAKAENDWRTVEVGTGPGTLTRVLSDLGGDVVTFEIDAAIAEIARQVLAGRDNVHLVLGDCLAGKHALSPELESALAEGHRLYGGRVRLVANLPYSIAAPLILGLLESTLSPQLLVVMVQEEVAERLAASEGSKIYGALSVLIQWLARVEKVVDVPPERFWPAPQIRSRVLKLTRRDPPIVDPDAYPALKALVQKGFNHRRKTLAKTWREDPEAVSAITSAGLDPRIRIEQLSPEALLELTQRAMAGGSVSRKSP
ncbi:MAG: 16S rRNA (adenine(1518)-N(6)/adenine(1519)-N(6))-dimethyltransferase RsmA [Planctomycetota bacterium]